MEAGEDALRCACGMEEIIGKNLSKNLIISIVMKNVLFIGTTIVDVIVGTRDKDSFVVDAWH